MQLPIDTALQQKFRSWSRYLIITVGVIALLVLIGWQFDITGLKQMGLPPTSMNPLTAIGFLMISIAVFLFLRSSHNITAFVLTIIVVIIGIAEFGAFLFNFDWQLDTVLYANKLAEQRGDGLVNQMAPNTAFCFLLAGISLILFKYEAGLQQRTSHYLVLIVAFIGMLSLLSQLYNVDTSTSFLAHISMAPSTALCFFLFSLSVLFADADKGVMKEFSSSLVGSVLARVLIPAAIIIPAVLGLLHLQGYWTGIYNNEFGTALYSLSIIFIFVAIIWYNAYLLNKRDLLRKQTENALRDSEQHIQAIFRSAPDAVIVMDSKGIVTKWNPEAEHLLGWKEEETRGRLLAELIIPEEFREAHKRGLERFLHTGESRIIGKTIDLWAIKKNRESIDVSLRISPLLLEGNRFFIGFVRDITEKKEIENRLKTFNEELSRQVEEKTNELTDIFERITDGFIALDKNFNYTYVNEKAGELIHRDPVSLIGKNIWEEFPLTVGSETYHAFIKAMTEQTYVANTDYYAPLNLWQANYIYPSPNGLSIFIRDISEQKKAETEVNKARDLAEKLIGSLPGVFYFFDANGRFIRWNREFERVTGYTSKEIENMHPTDFFGEESKAYIAQRIESVFMEGINDAETSFLTKDGRRIPYYFKAVLINFEGKPCLLGNGVDIAERKRAEEELISSEQKYKFLFENNPLSMWMLSLPDYNVVDVNNVALLKYGYTREEFLKLSMADFRPKEDVERFKASTNTAFRGIFHAGVWRHLKKDGTIIYVDIYTHDFYYKGQQTRLVLANDITEKHIAEQKLKESYESIRKLTGHLQNVREEERLHISREIHDELGQLLTVLKMDVSWLNKRIEPENAAAKEKLAEILGLIDSTVKSVRRIASELRPTLLDDLGLLAAMEWHLEEFERRSGIETESSLPEIEQPLPDALKIGLFRIFQESLTNVARHSGAKKVKVSLQQRDKELVLTVHDNGKGFDESGTVKKTLGLLGMKERTLMMGGQYNISGIIGEGTTVTVAVPLPNADL
ncbi:PAS domain S-box protein [Terrimonas alba]|uniref:PAS domain S-box protein n=1 Tax=Terrimonas alba TaxID=3349636 RepID=UPI0035F4A62E